MLGIVPSSTKTFEVIDYMDSKNLREGRLYADRSSGRLYMYSRELKRACADSGFFPIWDGVEKFDNIAANHKYLDKDVTLLDLSILSQAVDSNVAREVRETQRKADDRVILEPVIAEEDNAFTQCIKGAIAAKRVTLTDLIYLANGKLSDKMIYNYYQSLQKISFMRLEKWLIWLNVILHLDYVIKVYRGSRLLVSYISKTNNFDTGPVKYDCIANSKDDPFKKVIKILMVKENISKSTLNNSEIDDYTINNLLTSINSDKAISSQLFGRFMKIAKFNYEIILFDKGNTIFKYRETHKKIKE